MHKKLFLLISVSLISFFMISCSKKYKPDALPETQLHFGSGGGITGASTEYILLDNGQLFRNKATLKDKPELETMKVSKKAAKEAFEQFKTLGMDKMTVDVPGNIYYYMAFQEKDTTYRITWGAANVRIHGDIIKMYQTLNDLVK